MLHQRSGKDEKTLPGLGDHENTDEHSRGNRASLAQSDGGLIHGLPRLAIIGDIFIERTAGGALLLYRLFQEYPPDRLLVVFNSAIPRQGDPAKRLPGVEHISIEYTVPTVVRNRLHPIWPMVLSGRMRRGVKEVLAKIQQFAPEAILTVPYDFFWLCAAVVAQRLDIPLHLILHDDWPSTVTSNRRGLVGNVKRWFCRRTMRPVYGQAVSRMCVSPGMVDQYRTWFGIDGTVLYPNRGVDSPTPEVRVRSGIELPVVAYCGLIHQAGTANLLRELASILGAMNGYLDYYGPYSAEQLATSWGLAPPVVRANGFFAAAEMGDRVARSAHAVFLPASFEAQERIDVSTLFPSKLADYTAIGLPVLIWAPKYSSAARWAAENAGAAVLVTDSTNEAVRDALVRIVTEPEYASRIAVAGVEAGQRYFGYEAVRGTFFKKLRAGGE